MTQQPTEGQTVLLIFKLAEFHEQFVAHGDIFIQGTIVAADYESSLVLYCHPKNGVFVRQHILNENLVIV
jgi:hypothetical protein